MTQSMENSPVPFEKALKKIYKRNPKVGLQIFKDIAHLEETAHSIRNQKKHAITTKVKYLHDGIWQLTSGDYRVWYKFDEDDEIEYLQIFKKEKNSTPKRHFETAIRKKGAKAKDIEIAKRLSEKFEKKSSKKKKNKKDRPKLE